MARIGSLTGTVLIGEPINIELEVQRGSIEVNESGQIDYATGNRLLWSATIHCEDRRRFADPIGCGCTLRLEEEESLLIPSRYSGTCRVTGTTRYVGPRTGDRYLEIRLDGFGPLSGARAGPDGQDRTVDVTGLFGGVTTTNSLDDAIAREAARQAAQQVEGWTITSDHTLSEEEMGIIREQFNAAMERCRTEPKKTEKKAKPQEDIPLDILRVINIERRTPKSQPKPKKKSRRRKRKRSAEKT